MPPHLALTISITLLLLLVILINLDEKGLLKEVEVNSASDQLEELLM